MPYRLIDPTETLENAPLTAFLGDAFRQNEIAVREGQEDAPRIQWKMLGASYGAGATVISGLEQWQGGLLIATVTSTNPITTFNLEFSLDGVTYFAGTSFSGKDSGAVDNVVVSQFRFFDFPGGTVRALGAASAMGGSGLITHARFTRTAGSGQLSYMWHLQGGNSVF